MVEEEMAAPLEEMQLPEELIKYKVVIYNSSNADATFFLGESTNNLKEIKLKAKKNTISESFTVGPVFIIYTSKNIFSKYTLELGESYKIYFDNEKNKWDLSHLVISDP
jgi:hypothetical protein